MREREKECMCILKRLPQSQRKGAECAWRSIGAMEKERERERKKERKKEMKGQKQTKRTKKITKQGRNQRERNHFILVALKFVFVSVVYLFYG
jgi:50S ribosomal subunit-associated GTPase HflX